MALGLLRSRRARSAADGLTETQQRLVWRIAALVLDYPHQSALDLLGDLRAAAVDIPGPAGAGLTACIDDLRGQDPIAAAVRYVETFDLRRRSSLHLSYYAYGDTRKRGMALLDIKQAYQFSGVDLSEEELPDHLCVLLEFTATVDPAVGRVLLGDNRPGIELLRISLSDRGSVYAAALEALTGTFPTLLGDEKDVVLALIAAGPPDEEVGMEAYQSGSLSSDMVRR